MSGASIGYVAGGRVDSPFARVMTVDKFTFSTDARSTLTNGLMERNGLGASFDYN